MTGCEVCPEMNVVNIVSIIVFVVYPGHKL